VIEMPVALISIGPGSPLMLLAKNVRIEPPRAETQVLHSGGRPYIYNVGLRLGSFRAESIQGDLHAWRSACLHASLTQHRAGTMMTVETEARHHVCDLQRFLITSVGHEVHAKHDHGTACIAHHVNGNFWDANQY